MGTLLSSLLKKDFMKLCDRKVKDFIFKTSY